MAHASPTRRPLRWKRAALVAGIGFVVLIALTWLVAPMVVSARLQAAAQRGGFEIEIGRLGLLASLSHPVDVAGLVVATHDAPSSPLLSIDRALLGWAGSNTPRAEPFSRLPPRLVLEGLRLDIVRDRTGAGNYRPTKPTTAGPPETTREVKTGALDSPPPSPRPKRNPATSTANTAAAASGGAGAKRTPPERVMPWLTHVVVRDARASIHHDSPDSKTRGGAAMWWDEIEVRRQAPRTEPDGRVVERLDVAIDNLGLDGPAGWGQSRAMLRLPSLVASIDLPLPFEGEDDDTVPLPRLTRLDMQGGSLRRARDHKGRWQETHLQRVVASIRDRKPPRSDEDGEKPDPQEASAVARPPVVESSSTSSSGTSGAIAAADGDETPDGRIGGFVVEQATLRDVAVVVEALTPSGLESVTYTLDTADWLGAHVHEKTVLPRRLVLEGHAGEEGTFRLDWSRRVDPTTGDAEMVRLTLHTRALPFHPFVWGAWKHDRPEMGEVRRALMDADYELAWDRTAGTLATRGTFTFRDVMVLPDRRPVWERLMQPAPSAWPSILNDLTHGGTTEAEPIVFDERRTLADFDVFLAWQVAQDIFIAARLAAAERARALAKQQP